jgi:Mrp family chromosome partitioning ATPase
VENTLGLRNRQSPKNFTAVLRGEADLEESLIRCDNSSWYFLPPGPVVSNPAEILNSPQFENTIRRCTETFDWVIVDAPPVLAAADVNVISPFFDALLLVVHSGKTPTRLVKESVKRIGHDRILGLLMNQVKAAQSAGYYGGYYTAAVEQSARTSTSKL